jgi:hypothetical protein
LCLPRVPEDFIPAYEGFANLCFMVWAQVRARFLSAGPSLATAYLPGMMTQKHLEHVALYRPGDLRPVRRKGPCERYSR